MNAPGSPTLTVNQDAPAVTNAEEECAAASVGGAAETPVEVETPGRAGAFVPSTIAGSATRGEAALAAAAELQQQQPQLPMFQQRSTLSAEQVQALKAFEIKLRIDNEKYLAAHPELSELLLAFLGAVLEHQQRLQPQQRLHEQQLLRFAGRFFTQPNLREIAARVADRHTADATFSHAPGR